MVCTNCGSENKSNRRFCGECGASLEIVCPSCGAANDPVDKFCGDCGRALDATEPEPSPVPQPHERRFVSILFADLVGFTTFGEDHDPESVRAVLTTYYERARDIITRTGGIVEKFIGDAVMAVWGATVTHEDDAERAVRAGLELAGMVVRLRDELGVDSLDVRVGVLSGEASVAPATPDRGFIVGDLVNTASRLQSIAPPGAVVVGETTRQLLEGFVEFEPLGEQSLKGKAEPVAVWRADRLAAGTSRLVSIGGVEPAFVGRREELRLLKDALEATERVGRARLVSVVGEAGIGKSRLAWELKKHVLALDRHVYWHDGRSPAYDQPLTLWALGEMVRQRAGITETDTPRRSRDQLRTSLAEFVPSRADRQWIEPRLAALLGLDGAATGDRSEFFAAIRAFFQAIARRHTTLLVFEDFHWADSGLIEFVTELVELSTQYPILVLTLSRPDLLDRAPGWGAGRRDFASTHLGPLTDHEMAQLVQDTVRGIDDDVVGTITRRANGVPLYAVELIRMLIADGDLEMADDACCTPTRDLSTIRVPDTVRAVIGARLDRLPAPSRELLEEAAVIGAVFTRAGLAVVSGVDDERLDVLLDELVHRELLEFESDPRSPERGRFRFVQGMIREVAYERLAPEARRLRHVRAAEFFAERGDDELAGAVAGHITTAHRITEDPEDARALAHEATLALSDAADRAARLHSHEEGLAMIEQALAFVTDEASKAALWTRAARSASALARHRVATQYARRALDWYQEHGDRDEVANAAELVGDVLCHSFRAPEAIAVLEPIVEADPGLDDPSVVGVGAQLARAYLMALRDHDAARMGGRVLRQAERLDLTPTIVNTLITRGTALGNLGRRHEAIALLHGATRFAREHDLPLAEMRAANNVGHLLVFDDHHGAMVACREGLEQANRVGDIRFISSFALAVAAYLERDGRYEEAQSMRDEVRDRIQLPRGAMCWFELSDLTARLVRDDHSAIDPAFEAAARVVDEEDPQSRAGVPLATARLNLLTGRLEAAYDGLMNAEYVFRYPDHFALATTAAALLRDVARLEAVEASMASAPARGRVLDSIQNMTVGSIAGLRGQTDAAVDSFVRALDFKYLRFDRALLQGLFATVVGREHDEARIASDAAYDVLATCGAAAYIDLYAAGMPTGVERWTAAG
jgi:class 3 adenylate cyclase/tetratricopeptide (TPR) repeat protein